MSVLEWLFKAEEDADFASLPEDTFLQRKAKEVLLSGDTVGIGSGVLKVIAMDNLMKVPFKVSTTTSNFMMGVTACASAVVYLQRGNIDPGIACPVMIGVLLGALTGARLLKRLDVRLLRKIFSVAVLMVAVNMIWQGFNGQF